LIGKDVDMPYYLAIELIEGQKADIARLSPKSWFRSVAFKNANSPQHPSFERKRDARHELKQQLIRRWIQQHVAGKRGLDLFCANGVFAVEAALAGAREVVGIEFGPERVASAQFFGRHARRQG